jgi:transcriptional regulator with XRE-family HTH domain
MVTSEQVKAARKLLGWSQLALALEANVTQATVTNFETGRKHLSMPSVSTIKRTLEGAGVEFPEGEPGVRLRKAVRSPQIRSDVPKCLVLV